MRSDYDTQMSEIQKANIDQQNKLESEMTAKHDLQSEVSQNRNIEESVFAFCSGVRIYIYACTFYNLLRPLYGKHGSTSG